MQYTKLYPLILGRRDGLRWLRLGPYLGRQGVWPDSPARLWWGWISGSIKDWRPEN